MAGDREYQSGKRNNINRFKKQKTFRKKRQKRLNEDAYVENDFNCKY